MKKPRYRSYDEQDKSVIALSEAASELVARGLRTGLSRVNDLGEVFDPKIKLYKLSKRLSGVSHSFISTQLPLYLSPGAIELLQKKTLNSYWFWLAVHFASNYAPALPLTVEQVEAGMAQLRSQLLRFNSVRFPVIARGKKHKNLSELTQLQLALCVERGLIMIKTDYSQRIKDQLLVNPLFS